MDISSVSNAKDARPRSGETDIDQSTQNKRPRLKPRIPAVPSSATAPGENEALGEVLQRLRRDVDQLSRINHQKSVPPGQPVQLIESTAQTQPSAMGDLVPQPTSDLLYPLDLPGVSPGEPNEVSSDSSHTDTFNSSSVWGSPGAIANKIGAIRGAMLSDWFLDESMFAHGNKTVPLTLPPPAQLRHQVDLFLSEFDDYSPFFRNACLQQRISAALHSLSYSERRTTIYVPSQHCTTFAILSNIIWFAETVTASISTMDPNTGQNWFLQGKRLMEEFEDVIGDSLEVVAYHMLAAGSLMEAEKLRQAALHIVRALHTARSIGLGDKDRWKGDPDSIIAPRCLLMVLYFQEKRVHYKCGIPYLLRPDDVDIDEFLPLSGEPGIDDAKLEVVEAMVSYSKLWTSIWSDLLAPNAKHAGKWSEMQIADAKVVIKYQELAERLLWDTNKVQEYVVSGVTVTCMRQKLQAFLAPISNPRADPKRQRSCFNICKSIVAAIASYVERFVCKRPVGYFLTCSLVDCVFYLKQEQTEPSTFAEQVDLRDLFKEIKDVLESLALSVGCAQRALDALRCVLVMSSDWNFGVESNDSSGASQPVRTNPHGAFTDKGRLFVTSYSDGSLTETMDFLGVLPM
ncbi:hypothetical protein H2200_009225 [Cladophialophora chaetospira]|uniref:Transcription factor domain-containing protein n=1 Tax=Cladophialophora chaetospira TaxID=386627 RepID=A0AA39CFE7_9EURO|nr:hypothetical protein H2200_009225 [Cladophialophora chaetospira]